MVVPARVEGQFSEQLAVGGEHADVEVADEDQDAGSGVAAAETDVEELAPAVRRGRSTRCSRVRP